MMPQNNLIDNQIEGRICFLWQLSKTWSIEQDHLLLRRPPMNFFRRLFFSSRNECSRYALNVHVNTWRKHVAGCSEWSASWCYNAQSLVKDVLAEDGVIVPWISERNQLKMAPKSIDAQPTHIIVDMEIRRTLSSVDDRCNMYHRWGTSLNATPQDEENHISTWKDSCSRNAATGSMGGKQFTTCSNWPTDK